MIIKMKCAGSKEPTKNMTFTCKDTAEDALRTFIRQLVIYGFTEQEIQTAIEESKYYV